MLLFFPTTGHVEKTMLKAGYRRTLGSSATAGTLFVFLMNLYIYTIHIHIYTIYIHIYNIHIIYTIHIHIYTIYAHTHTHTHTHIWENYKKPPKLSAIYDLASKSFKSDKIAPPNYQTVTFWSPPLVLP
jgi:hypothetical protein